MLKDVAFTWSEEADDSFHEVKEIVTRSPNLKPFRADMEDSVVTSVIISVSVSPVIIWVIY